MKIKSDILIIGSGIAGLSLALKAARTRTVLIVTKREAVESNTRYAQGGIASVMDQLDDFDSHIRDTITAGANLCDAQVVERVVEAGPRLINELLKIGVKFNRMNKTDFDLAIEGGHSRRRVLHASDITGYEIESKLLAAARKNPRIRFLEHHAAVDLIVDRHLTSSSKNRLCYGAYILDTERGTVLAVHAKATILATGGSGKLYLYTSNPDIATGDGVAMAARAGCRIANLEFVQFHPTCLYHPKAKSFLISEALRGEGGKLRLIDGTAFMNRYHKLKDLAPRDVVARAIDFELKKRGDSYVLLDMTHKSRAFLKKRFPNIYAACTRYGYDLAREPIPVVPAAHYSCGGVMVDASGRTDLTNLYAIGEVSCTGLHGANRLASNSLLEGLAYADFAARDLENRKDLPSSQNFKIRPWQSGSATESDEAVVITQNWDEIRRFMWNYVGIVRTNKRLSRAQNRIAILQDEIREYYWNFKLTRDLIELRNLALVADLTIRSALKRKESIGLHFNSDFPNPAKQSMRFNIVSGSL